MKKKIIISILIPAVFALYIQTSNAATFDPATVAPNFSTSGNTGRFTTSIPISVPSYHGIEPKFSLGYSSGASNGFAGVGWGIGFGAISRTSSEGGVPNWDNTDKAWFSGNELIGCQPEAQMPSCTTGGTHWTKNETYQRIKYDSSDNKWIVTDQNGAKYTYELLMEWPGEKYYSWGLKTVEDIHGNTVTYNYWCDTDSSGAEVACYPATAIYNNTTITFHRESRPDLISFATGATMGYYRYRLDSIEVSTSGNRVRKYDLTYDESLISSRSLLKSVQIYGRTDSAEATLPVTTYTYRDDDSYDSFQNIVLTTGFCKDAGGYNTFGTGDFNADGFTDVYCHYGSKNGSATGNTEIYHSNGDGTFSNPVTLDHRACGDDDIFSTGDFNADGSTDFVCQQTWGGYTTSVDLNQEDGSFSGFSG
jgi:hypothetical protein